MRRVLFLALVASAAAVPVACSSKKPNPPMTPSTPLVDAGDDGGDAEASDTDGGLDDGGLTGGDGGAPNMNAMLAQAADAMIDGEVAKLAAKVAPGMTLEGQAYRETLGPNGHLNVIITLQPNRCYTIIGYSPKDQITQLDMQLLAPPLFNFATNRAASPKNESVIGKGKEALCPVSLVPLPYKVDAIASKGAGRVGVYVYAKNK